MFIRKGNMFQAQLLNFWVWPSCSISPIKWLITMTFCNIYQPCLSLYHLGVNPRLLMHLQSLEYSINARIIMGNEHFGNWNCNSKCYKAEPMFYPLLFTSLNVYSPAKGNAKVSILFYRIILPLLRSSDGVTFIRSQTASLTSTI